jgi:restriction system protein
MLRPDETLMLHPQRLEDVVGSIFGDFGYRSRVTAYHADGGIDAYLDGNNGLVGVQVKRTKNPIEIEQVNSLTGALLVNDCTSGVFVTTSRFPRGAKNVASKARARGLPIKLYDGSRLLQALEVAQLGASFDPEDPANPWMALRVHRVFQRFLRPRILCAIDGLVIRRANLRIDAADHSGITNRRRHCTRYRTANAHHRGRT